MPEKDNSLTRSQKMVAIVAGLVTASSLMLTGLNKLIELKANAAVAPVRTEITAHENLPGHSGEMETLRQLSRDIAYIRGKVDEHGSKTAKTGRKAEDG